MNIYKPVHKLLILLVAGLLLTISLAPPQVAARPAPQPVPHISVSGDRDNSDQSSNTDPHNPIGNYNGDATGGNSKPNPPIATVKATPKITPTPAIQPGLPMIVNPNPLPTREAGHESGHEGSESYTEIEQQMLVQTNQARRANGLGPLRENANLATAAHWMADDMATHNIFGHTDSQGRAFDVRLAAFGYWHNSGGIAENLAAGFANVPAVIAAWLGSPGHRANMLNSAYREMGMGYAYNSASTYGTYWVQDFGFTLDVYPVVINDEQPTSNNAVVQLYIYGTGWATEMQVSNDPNFGGASWQPYQRDLTWQLVGGNGIRTVYVKLRDGGGQTLAPVSDSIILINQPTFTPTRTATPTQTPTPTATPTPSPGQVFPDVACSYWDYNAIQSLALRGIVSGKSDGLFHPTDQVTRAEFARMIVKGSGWTLVTPSAPDFSDVPPSYWAYAYIETAYQHGVMNGYPDGNFQPNALLSRDQLAKIVVEARGYSGYYPPTPSFSDVPTNYWAFGYIEQAHRLNIINGYGNGQFRPRNLGQRDELSQTLYVALNLAVATPTATPTPLPTNTPTP